MHLSYWERKTWFQDVDFTIIGSGIVGLNCALRLREKYPKSKIVVLERGFLPTGASTKNAGFACFGSLSEILEDLKHHSEEQVFSLIQQRYNGLQLLRKNLGDRTIGYKNWGGYELFLKSDPELLEACIAGLQQVNQLLQPFFKSPVFIEQKDHFGFQNTYPQLIFNPLEAQIDTGKMMQALLRIAHQKRILILNGITVTSFEETPNHVEVALANNLSFSTQKLWIATNGFSATLLQEDIRPARAQVLITKPIKNLPVQGTFHLDRGYYYFRNIDNRLLLGGGRNLDFKTEETTQLDLTPLVQNQLENFLKNIILPNTPFEIEHRWSGIMGVGTTKTPIIKAISNRVFCGIRLSGMGVAIGTQIGNQLAEFA